MIKSIEFLRGGITRTTYQTQKIRITAKYACKCGHKFTRINVGEYTLNPFNANKSETQIRKEVTEEQKNKVRLCPKCQNKVKPVKKK